MSGKKPIGWKSVLGGLSVTTALDLLGVLLVTLLTVWGTVGEESCFPLLLGAAFCASFAGGLTVGNGAGGAAAMLNAGVFGAVLVLICLSVWDGVTIRGLILLAAVLLGGVLSGLLRVKVGNRRRKRLVKSNKKRI